MLNYRKVSHYLNYIKCVLMTMNSYILRHTRFFIMLVTNTSFRCAIYQTLPEVDHLSTGKELQVQFKAQSG